MADQTNIAIPMPSMGNIKTKTIEPPPVDVPKGPIGGNSIPPPTPEIEPPPSARSRNRGTVRGTAPQSPPNPSPPPPLPPPAPPKPAEPLNPPDLTVPYPTPPTMKTKTSYTPDSDKIVGEPSQAGKQTRGGGGPTGP